jgi:hypothetical protein
LWFQFQGPQGISGGLFNPSYFSADVASWVTLSPLTIASLGKATRFSTGAAEYNTFLGWPLVLVALGCAIWLIRRPVALGCTLAGLVMAGLALGPELVISGKRTKTDGPFSLLEGLPLVEGALPNRFGLVLLPLIATLLVLAVDRALGMTWRPARFLVPSAAGVALLSVLPAPLPTAGREPLPRFITSGAWRECVEPGGVLVPGPLPTPTAPWTMRWATAADTRFRIPEGFFIAPYGKDGGASMGTYKEPTSGLLAEVATKGTLPTIGDDHRRQARSDIAFWGASCVALSNATRFSGELLVTLEALLGPGTMVADTWVWRV